MSKEKYIPNSKLAQWFDSRFPLLSLSHHLQSYPTPKNLNYWWTFGGILTFCLITQIVTGSGACDALCSSYRLCFSKY